LIRLSDIKLTNTNKKRGNKSTPKQMKKDQAARKVTLQNCLLGRELWCGINRVVFLTKNWRSKKDRLYAELLTSMRVQHTHRYDSKLTALLKARVAQKNVDALTSAKFRTAPFICSRNDLCGLMNNLRLKNEAKRTGQRIVVSVAEDNYPKYLQDDITPTKMIGLFNRPYKQSGNLPGYLPLIQGMPAFITMNGSVPLGIVNMAKCEITQVVLHEDEPAFSKDYRLPPHFLKYPPKAVYVKLLDHDPKDSPLKSLPNQQRFVVPIALKRTTYHLCKEDERKKGRSIKRQQLPLTPGYSFTSYSCQVCM
jgi:hypothetical protein